MAINKKLIHFKNKENFDKEVANENILDSSIVFIQDSKEISTHGTVYKSVNWSILEEFINFSIVSRFGTANCLAIKGMTWEDWINSEYSSNIMIDNTYHCVFSSNRLNKCSIYIEESGGDLGSIYSDSSYTNLVDISDNINNMEYFALIPISIVD